VFDEAVTREFGDLLPATLEKYGFREIARYVDDIGWFTRTYFNGNMGARLVYHLGRNLEFMPRSEMESYYSIGQVGKFFGDEIRDDSPNDEKAGYLDRNLPRLERLFGELDGGAGRRELREYILKEHAKLFKE
jgi:hypothetical protein